MLFVSRGQALLIRGVLPAKDFTAYVCSQLVGALIAAICAVPLPFTIGHPAVAGLEFHQGIAALIAEIVLTFALCHVVIHTATTTYADGKAYYGLAIGFTVVSGAISVGGVSGGAFNPAVSVLTIFGGNFLSLWVYWLGPLIGGACAGMLFRVTHPHEVDGSSAATGPAAAYATLTNKPASSDFVIEFVGTFLLSFTVATAAGRGAPLAALSIGSMLMVVVYAGGPRSKPPSHCQQLSLSLSGSCAPSLASFFVSAPTVH